MLKTLKSEELKTVEDDEIWDPLSAEEEMYEDEEEFW